MERKTKFAIISILSFAISLAFTVALFVSNASGKWAISIMFVSAIVIEMSKWFLLWEGFSGKHSVTFSSILISLWALVTIGSIVASCGYVLNQANTVNNKAMVESSAYRQAEEGRKVMLDAFNSKKSELEQLRKQADGLPSNYFTMKQNIMDKVTAKSNELSTLSSQLQQPIKVTSTLSENGYDAFFKLVGELLDIDPVMLALYFFMALGVLIESNGNIFAYLYQKEKFTSVAPNVSQTQPTAEVKPKRYMPKSRIPEKKKHNVIPFVKKNEIVTRNVPQHHPTAELYTDEEIENYIKLLKENTNEKGIVAGAKKMAELMEWGRSGEEKSRAIMNMLKMKGIVESVGTKTKLIKEVV